jgi:hypothetical protein
VVKKEKQNNVLVTTSPKEEEISELEKVKEPKIVS